MEQAKTNNDVKPAGYGARIFYAAGPGNPLGVFRNWLEGRDDPDQVAVAYTTQFFDVCRDLNATAYVVGSNSRADSLTSGSIRVEHRPPSTLKGGAAYHVGQLGNTLGMMASAIRFRADVVVYSNSNTPYWFLLSALTTMGVKVVPSLHCVIWPKHARLSGSQTRLQKWNGRFFRKKAAAILSLSDDITSQLRELGCSPSVPIIPFRPSYRPERFAMSPPPPDAPPFRVLYAGRIERNKGVFDLLEIARRFAREGRTDIEFDLCGTGQSAETLRREAEAAAGDLGGRFRIHGHCNGEVMATMFGRCHVVIVPTTTDFIEGFNKVVAEGVLAGRPVITSSVCPALEYVDQVVEVVPPDNVPAYGDAILRLADDPHLYAFRRHAGEKVRDQFYDPSRGWGAALKTALRRAFGPTSAQAETAADVRLASVHEPPVWIDHERP